jgi:hypothetical protein
VILKDSVVAGLAGETEDSNGEPNSPHMVPSTKNGVLLCSVVQTMDTNRPESTPLAIALEL